MSDEIFGGQKVTQVFPITVGGLPDLNRRPQRIIFPRVELIALKGQDNFTKTYEKVTIRSSNADSVLGDVVPGDYTLEYAAYGLDSEGNTQESYYPPQPSDRIFSLSGVRDDDLDNNVFIDDSLNNFTIDRNGTTTQGSVSPYESTLSADFGSGDNYVVVESSENLTLGTDDFTVEGWIKPFNESYNLITSSQPFNFNLGYNLDNNEQGLVLGLEDVEKIEEPEEIRTINVDEQQNAIIANTTDRIIFIAELQGNQDAAYQIAGLNSSEIGGLEQFGEMTLSTDVGTSIFPQSYQTQIDSFSGDKRYIDIENGNDSNTGLGINSAWKTYDYAVAQTTNITTPVMLIFMPGVYSVTSTLSVAFNIAETFFEDGNFHREIVCAPGKVVFQWTASSGRRDAPLVMLLNSESKIHGAIIERDNQGRTDSYAVSFFLGFGARGILRNCVFKEMNANNRWSLHYDNNNNFPILIDQCVFFTEANGLTPWSGGAGVDVRNSVFTRLSGSSITLTNSITNATVDPETYITAGTTSQGVYFGLYSWEEETVEVDVFKLEVPLTFNVVPSREFTFTVTRDEVDTTVRVGFEFLSNFDTTGEAIFDEPGTYSWTVPFGVNSVSAVCVGGGGGPAANTSGGSGGGGGGLGWRNNIPVTPGETYTVVVGAGGTRTTSGIAGSGGDSYFIDIETVAGLGGEGGATGTNRSRQGGPGGGFVGDGGGFGGTGGASTGTTNCGGGGGAGGYIGDGGDGGAGNASNTTRAESGRGGGGGGGGRGGSGDTAGSGGGVGIFGRGPSGGGGANSSQDGHGGFGGSGGTDASEASAVSANNASLFTATGTLSVPGLYGGGGAGADTTALEQTDGGHGAVRIIWGENAIYPRGTIPDPKTVKPVIALGGIESEYEEDNKRYKVHTFLSSGLFLVNFETEVECLIVAGGGAGSNYGGGGAGGVLTSTEILTTGSYPVTVGAGGAGGITGNNGNNSSFLELFAIGGGRGGVNTTPAAGADGGSGGGGNFGGASGGLGIEGQGNDGGNGGPASPVFAGGGGGGAGSEGQAGQAQIGGAGGSGIESNISGLLEYYAGGGGGGHFGGTGENAEGAGDAGGGDGGKDGAGMTPGDANTGGGGGGYGNSSFAGASGGSGIVIIRYLIDENSTILGPSRASLGDTLEYTVFVDSALEIEDDTVASYTISGLDPASVSGNSLTGNIFIVNNRARLTIKTVAVGASSTVTISVTVPVVGTISTTTELEISDNFGFVEASGGVELSNVIEGELYKIHAFLTSDTFEVTNSGLIDILVVGGGGGGANLNDAGGGGAGGVININSLAVEEGVYTIVVGAGGAIGADGENSSAFGITSGFGQAAPSNVGAGSVAAVGGDSGFPQNNVGGLGGGFATDGGGGAGAGGDGFNAGLDGIGPGRGGPGLFFADTFTLNFGDNGWFASGGGGGGENGSPAKQPGGGGTGGQGTDQTDRDALPNTGGGGGGNNDASPFSNSSRNAGSGGSGVVLIRYVDATPEQLNSRLLGPKVATWGDTLEYTFREDLPDGTLITYSISNLDNEDVVSGIVPSSAAYFKNGGAKIKLATVDTNTSIKSITVVILNVNNPDGTAITFTTQIQPTLKLVTNSFFDLNQWNHFAVTRETNNLRMYINGQRKLTANIGGYNFSNDLTSWTIGGSEKFLNGRLADLRLLSGEARYTQPVESVPDLRFNPRSGTKLLTFNRSVELTNLFQDISEFDNTITSFGVTNVYDNPVGYRVYTPRQGYGSGWFDNSGNNLLINYNSALHLNTDFTIECWFYANAYGGMILNFAGGLNIAWASYELVNNSDGVNFAASSANSGYNIGSETGATGRIGTIQLGTWNHLAVTRSGDVYRGFVNGVQGYTQILALTPYDPNARGLAIGSNYSGTWGGTPSSSINGFIADLRIINGVAVYESDFTPPINPLETTPETVLHLKFDNASVYDEIRNKNISFNNGAVTNTTVVNERLLSIDCTGTRYITVSLPRTQRLNMAGTGIWSLEFNFLNTAFTTNTAVATYGRITTWAPWLFWISGTSLLFYSSSNNSSWNIANGPVVIVTMTPNTWYKIRLTRTSQGYQIFVDGNLVLTVNHSGNFFTPPNNFLAFGATTSGATPSSIYVEDIKFWNTTEDATQENRLGLQEAERFIGHTYPEGFFDDKDLDFTINYLDATLGISSSNTRTQRVSIGVVKPIISYRTQTRLQFVVGPDGSVTLVDTTPGNDPTIDRNPRPIGDEGPPTPRRIWY